jgi:hypothetical protein
VIVYGTVALMLRCLILVVAAQAAGMGLRLCSGRVAEARQFPMRAAAAWHSVVLYVTLTVFCFGACIIQVWGLHRPLALVYLPMYSATFGFLVFGWLERETFRARERATAAGDHRAVVRARVRHR